MTYEFMYAGLGWTSSFNTWFSSVFGVVQSQDFLTPNMLIQSPVGSNSISSATFAGWQQLQIFDKYIYATETGKSWVDSAKVITSFTGPSRTTLANWVPLFQQSGAPYQEAQTCYKTATSGYRKLEFRIPSTAASKGGSSVYLQTLDQWLPGSSIAHADLQSYVTGPDFLMIPDVTGLTGRTLDTILAAQSPGWKYGPIGPLTAGMLSAMGWPTLIAAQDGNVTVNGTTDGATTPNTPSGTPTTPTKIGPFTIPQFVGIVVGALAVAGLLVAGAIFFSRRRKNGKAPSASGASSSPGYILNAYPSHPSVPPPVYRHEAPPNVLPNGAAVFYGYPSSAPQNPYLNGAYGAAAASSPQERADAELARTLQEQEEAFAGIPLAAVANRGTRPPPIAGPSPVSRAPPPAPPALPPRRMDDMAIEGDLSDYELAKRLQEEEERAAGISAAVAYGAQPRASPRPSFAAPLPPPPGGAAIETPTLGSIQDRIRALQSGSARPPGSYLND